ncbi:NAD-dependent dehydratase [Chryseolinea soli]|uniref:NAD-dependent dehydratase n=2 Tax=Chryseolinea soli TaxID=2321403 RepID=A0A385SFM0_9BACT|nr:NAD-dependent dehydratase [Chryseolinea soli]
MKKYVITGSLGHINKPLVAGLIQAKKDVTVITRDAGKVKEIEALGAKALVGSVSDQAFVNRAFRGAEVVYAMIPPLWQTDNWRQAQDEVGHAYADSIKTNRVPFVVNLSSVGAHLSEGCGPVNALHAFEASLNRIDGLHVKHLRPVSFYYNLLNQIGMIKAAGIMGNNYGGQKIAMVHTNDIAEVALEELTQLQFTAHSVRYIVSDLRTGDEIAQVLGEATGKKFPWVVFSDEDHLKGLLQAGIPASHAIPFVEMGTALRTGRMQEDLLKHLPALAPTKLEQFAKEFAAAFAASN